MIVTEIIEEDGTLYLHTYSDAGFTIIQDGTGEEYAEAIDPIDAGRTYTESNNPIEPEEKSE